MEKNTNIWKNAMNWGLIVGIALVIYSLIMYFLGLSLEKWVSSISYIIIIVGIIYSGIQYRDNILDGTLTYGKALGFGTLVALFASVITGIYSYVFFSFIDTEMISKMLEMAEEEMINKGLPDDQIEMAIAMQSKFMKPWIMSLMSIPSLTFMGFIFSLITSIFIKKNVEKSPFED